MQRLRAGLVLLCVLGSAACGIKAAPRPPLPPPAPANTSRPPVSTSPQDSGTP